MKPYLIAAVFSGVFGLTVLFAASSHIGSKEVRVYGAFWIITTINFGAFGMLGQALLGLASNQNLAHQPLLVMRSGIWGAIKLVCLGVLILAISRAKNYPQLAWMLGLANVFVMPLGGLLLRRFFKTEYV